MAVLSHDDIQACRTLNQPEKSYDCDQHRTGWHCNSVVSGCPADQEQSRQESGNHRELAQFHPKIERKERSQFSGWRQAEIGQGAGKTEPMDQAE